MTIERSAVRQITAMLDERGSRLPVTLSSSLGDDLALTSLNMIILVTGICDECGLDLTRLSDVELVQMVTVSDLVGILSNLRD